MIERLVFLLSLVSCDLPNRKSQIVNRKFWQWLSGMDSNHDKGLQRPLCYHYTTGQTDVQVKFPTAGAQRKSPRRRRLKAALECADLSALSAGDLSPSIASGRPIFAASRSMRLSLAEESAKRRKR